MAGEWDGAGAVIKRALRNEQLRNPHRELSNAAHCADFLRERFSSRVPSSYLQANVADVARRFWHIGVDDVARGNAWHCNTLPGSRSLHSVFGGSLTDPTLLMVRDLSCFCAPCVAKDWVNCERTSHVDPWRVVKLKPSNAQAVRDQIQQFEHGEGFEFGGVSGQYGDLVEIGDNFVVPAEPGNEEGVEFYVMQCQRSKFEVEAPFTCTWGGEFDAGDFIIGGTYYKKHGTSDNTFVFLEKSQIAYVHSHLVRAVKFTMTIASHHVKGGDAVYKMSSETLECVRSVLREWWDN